MLEVDYEQRKEKLYALARKFEIMDLFRVEIYYMTSIFRSMTYSTDLQSVLSSAKYSLLKTATMGMAEKMAEKAKRVAKDLNETVQASLDYYTNEMVGRKLVTFVLYIVC